MGHRPLRSHQKAIQKEEMNEPELSLVLPLYNVEQFVEECLCSIYCQPEAARVEVILVDDGSPDRSAAVAEAYLRSQPLQNWRIIHQENRGLGGARNTGLHATRAPYVWFIDTDDLLAPDALNAILPRIMQSNDDIIAFNYNRIPTEVINIYPNELHHLSGPEFTENILLGAVWRSVFKTNFLRKNNLYFKEKYLHEDVEFSLRTNFQAESISYYIDQIYLYRVNPDSITGKVKAQNCVDLLSALDTYFSIIENVHITEEQRKCMQKSIYPIYGGIYGKAKRLSISDWKKVRGLIWANRQKIVKSVELLPLKNRFKTFLFAYLPNRW